MSGASILTGSSWPSYILDSFSSSRAADAPQCENRYYGPYDDLLRYCFASKRTLLVIPQMPVSTELLHETVDFGVVLTVQNEFGKPVLFVEVKDDDWLDSAEKRFQADGQMRRRYQGMLEHCPVRDLWGLSVLGTSVRMYHGDKTLGDVHPPLRDRPSDDHVLPPDFLEGRWTTDILSERGFVMMKWLAQHIISSVEALP